MLTWDESIRNSLTQLSLGPVETQFIVFFTLPQFRNNYQAHDIFNMATCGELYQLFLNVASTLQVHHGDSRYDVLLKEFFSDSSRSGRFYLDGDNYASFAITFTRYLIEW